MCGICGVNSGEQGLVKKMNDSLRHRGPDGEGYHADGNIVLGIRRLAIIDLNNGNQPISNEDNTIWIVFNGEIYNYQLLRTALKSKGHIFRTDSDTEVIVHAYEEYGFDCVNELNGMFAFCIHDTRKNILFLARDRFGEKPLFYYYDGKRFAFASEIPALLADATIPRNVNDQIATEYLRTSRLPEDKEETFLISIRRVLPAHYIIYNIADKTIMKHKYYSITKVNPRDLRTSCLELQFYEIFEDSIKLRLLSDVPVGSCLSGGLDSSSIVCTIDQLLQTARNDCNSVGHKQQCFSAIFPNEKYDESTFMRAVTSTAKVHWNPVTPDGKLFLQELKRLVYHQGEPFEGTSVFAQWKVMEEASKKVKVVMDGQGSDEMLGGYLGYYRYYLADLLRRKEIGRFLMSLINRHDIVLSLVKEYIRKRRETTLISEMVKYDVREQEKLAVDTKSLSDRLEYDINHTIQKVLRYEDRNAMAFSVEPRLPFLDHRLVNFVFSIADENKINYNYNKVILRQAMKGIVPDVIRKRKDKIGFITPEARWLKENSNFVLDIFQSQSFRSRKYFDHEMIITRFKDFCEGRIDEKCSPIFWRILNLEIWLEIFIDQKE